MGEKSRDVRNTRKFNEKNHEIFCEYEKYIYLCTRKSEAIARKEAG